MNNYLKGKRGFCVGSSETLVHYTASCVECTENCVGGNGEIWDLQYLNNTQKSGFIYEFILSKKKFKQAGAEQCQAQDSAS